MKRSQMIKLLEDHFDEVCYQDYSPDADAVLSVIEKAGMLPPTIKITAFGVMDNAWEPEDEK
jgi:hypothetical protein